MRVPRFHLRTLMVVVALVALPFALLRLLSSLATDRLPENGDAKAQAWFMLYYVGLFHAYCFGMG